MLMKKLIKLVYSLGIRKKYGQVDRIHYLRRLAKKKHARDLWYYSNKDADQYTADSDMLVLNDYRGETFFFYCSLHQHTERRMLLGRPNNIQGLDLLAHFVHDEPCTILDIGANVGSYCVPLAKAFQHLKVYAYEPNPHALKRLKSNIEVNKLSNITTQTLAAGAKPGRQMFHANAGSDIGLSSFYGLSNKQQNNDLIEIEIVTLDQQHKNEKNPIVAIKIDAQGFEYDVLAGATQLITQHNPAIFFEYEANNFPTQEEAEQKKNELRDFFKSLNYQTFYLTKKDSSLMFPVDWEAPLDGDILALPQNPSAAP
jgi:FkbM family methyltransferase